MEIKPYNEILKKSLIFHNMNDSEIENGIKFFSGRMAKYSKGEMLNTVSSPLHYFGIVLEGLVHVCMADFEGQKCIMATVSAGESFGESLSFLEIDTDVYIRAACESVVLWLCPKNVKGSCVFTDEERLYVNRFIEDLAIRGLNMNDRIQIMSKRTVREKILTFLTLKSSQCESDEFSVPFDRNAMAVYLGTDRSSLSRELSKMKAEGIIDFKKNKFKIL